MGEDGLVGRRGAAALRGLAIVEGFRLNKKKPPLIHALIELRLLAKLLDEITPYVKLAETARRPKHP